MDYFFRIKGKRNEQRIIRKLYEIKKMRNYFLKWEKRRVDNQAHKKTPPLISSTRVEVKRQEGRGKTEVKFKKRKDGKIDKQEWKYLKKKEQKCGVWRPGQEKRRQIDEPIFF